VNDAPVNTVPGTQTVNEDTALYPISGISVNDVDNNLATTQLTVGNGIINVNLAGGATISSGSNGSNTLTLSGTQAQINAALATVYYQGALNFNGTDTLTVLSTDSAGVPLSDTDAITINVNAVNDAPVNTVPGAQSVAEDTALPIAGISVNDVEGNLATTQLTVGNGTINVNLAGGATISGGANGSNTLTLSGTQAQINAALATVTYQGTLNFNGTDTLTVLSTDSAGTPVSNTDAVTINVTPVNDAPVNTVPGAQSVNEDTVLAITGISVNDVEGNLATTQLTVGNGTINVDVSGGATISSGANGSSSLTLSGTQAQISAALTTVTYQGTLNFNGTDTFTMVSTDSAGTPLSDTDAVTINVNAVNDAPVNTLPGLQTVGENTSLPITGISVNDVDGNLASTRLTVVNGTINVSLAGGVTISGGANGSNTLTLSGTQAQINAALLIVNYQGNLNFTGADTLTVVSTDSAGTPLSDTDVVTINVNAAGTDPPVNTVPGAQTVNEDTALPITGISVNDANGNLASTRLTVGNGTINVNLAGGATISSGSNGSNTLTLSGTQAQINAALATVTYQGTLNFNGGDTLTVLSTDSSGVPLTDTDAVTINVTPVNDAPVNTVPGAQTVNEDTVLAITGISVNDVEGNLATTQLIVANGTINVNLAGGATISGGANGSNTLTLSGTQAQINAALATVTYQGTLNFNGTDTLTVLSTDSGGTPLSDTDAVTINVNPVNDAPVNTVPGAQTVNEDTTLPIAGISVNDVDNNLASTRLTVGNGTINVNLAGGATISSGSNGSNTLTLSGTQAQINAALATVSYQGTLNFNGTDTLTVLSTDSSGTPLSDTDAVTINVNAVNDAPVNTVPGAQTVNEDTALPIAGISVNDVDNNLALTQLTVGNGTINVNLAGGATISSGSNGSNTLTLSGTQAQINAALATVYYQGTLNFNGTDTLTVLSTDSAGVPLSDTDAVTINVNAVNDAPVNTVPAGPLAVLEDTSLPIAGISVNDVDNNLASTRLTVGNGTINVNLAGGATISGGANGSNTLTLSGTQAQINAALATVTYQGTLNFNGTDTLTVLSTDSDGTPLSDTDAVTINVTSIDDVPVNTVPGAQSVNEDTTLPIAGISVNDVDNNLASTRLTVGNGIINVNLAGGATISGGANGSNTLTLSGTQAQINAALATVTYQGTLNFNGADTLTVLSTDSSGVPLTDTDTVAITVNPVDDAPVNNFIAGPLAATEDTSLVMTGFSVTDFDAGNPTAVASTVLSVDMGGTLTVVPAGTATIGGNGTNSVTITGTAAEINAVLAGNVTYLGALNFNGAETVNMLTTDAGGVPLSDSDNIVINVAAVNDAPVNTVPAGPLAVLEDTSLPIAGISVNDVRRWLPGTLPATY
jgi:CTP-dependent riboflavin kinase